MLRETEMTKRLILLNALETPEHGIKEQSLFSSIPFVWNSVWNLITQKAPAA